MSVGDTRRPGVELRAVDPDGSERVRDFDQLDDEQQRAFLRLRRGEPAESAIRPGVVVRFTDYFRIERD